MLEFPFQSSANGVGAADHSPPISLTASCASLPPSEIRSDYPIRTGVCALW